MLIRQREEEFVSKPTRTRGSQQRETRDDIEHEARIEEPIRRRRLCTLLHSRLLCRGRRLWAIHGGRRILGLVYFHIVLRLFHSCCGLRG
jgi:hypothetical protein